MIYQLLKLKTSRLAALFAALTLGMLSSNVFAHDFEVDGIYYNKINDSEVAVTYKGIYGTSAVYSGDILIPETVSYDGTLYSVTSIGEYAFYVCRSITSVNIPNSVISIGNEAFSYCESMTSVNIGNCVNSIGLQAFVGCKSLTSVDIPNSVTTIGSEAFRYCESITSLSIGNSVASIGSYAFYFCPLETVMCLAVTPPTIQNYCFWGKRPKALVPKSSLEAYKASDWNGYFNDIEALPGLTIEIEGDGKVYNKGVSVVSGTQYSEGEISLIILADEDNVMQLATLEGKDIKGQVVNHMLTIPDCSYAGVLKIVFAPIEETTLTVKGNANCSTVLYYPEGTLAKIDIIPEEGWELYSLTFNGVDVTNDVVKDSYITPYLSGENILEIVMKSQINSGLDDIDSTQRKISFKKYGNTVEVFGIDETETISIFNANGVCEYEGNNHTVTLNPNNVYILRTRKEALKFAL